MKIVITEFMDTRAVAQLQEAHTVVYDPKLVDNPAHLALEAQTADALIVRNRTQVRGALIEALTQCKVIGRLGVGLDNIDVPACEAHGMQVIPATGANALSVAEYVIGTAMQLLRGAYSHTAAVAAGQWPRNALSNGFEINGKTLGLVGFGSIGQLTGQLGRALGMNVVAYDPMISADSESGRKLYQDHATEPMALEPLLQVSDVVSLHVPLTDATRGYFSASRLAQLKKGALLINTARGNIVDEVALAAALKSGHLGGAAIDVFAQEPLPMSSHFENCPNLILTPHIAGVSSESNERVSFMIADRVLAALVQP